MTLLEALKKEQNNLFQFYIVIGDGKKNKKVVLDFLKKNFSIDLFSWESDDFLIDISREVKKENSIYTGKSKKIIFLDFKKINFDTQNSLLKTFEEVSGNSHIFLFIPSEDFLLTTIKSRALILEGEKILDYKLALDFFEGNFLTREKIIQKIDKNNISVFINSLENSILKDKNIDKYFYKNFLELKKYIFDKGVSLKNILTWIAINL